MKTHVHGAVIVSIALFGIQSIQAQGRPGHTNNASTRDVQGRVFVKHATGAETAGRLLQLGPDTVRLLVDGHEKVLPLDDVLTIDREGDSLKNGIAIGAIATGIWCALVCGQGLDSESQWLPAVAASVGYGALIGAGVDALHRGRTNIYTKSPGIAAFPLRSRVAVVYRVSF